MPIIFRRPNPSTVKVLVSLFLVYISWGSGYLSNHFAIQSFPAFMMVGFRMISAGILLFIIAAILGARNIPTQRDLRHGLITSFFMVFIAAGFLIKGQETVPSGIAALILGAVPIWMTLVGWLFYKEERPSIKQSLGLLGGFTGLSILSLYGPKETVQSHFGLALIFISSFAWVIGTFYSKKNAPESKLSTMQSSGLLMLLGGIQSMICSLLLGEFVGFDFSSVTWLSLVAIAYTVIFGAVIGYTCYFWLLLNTRTIVAISYEFCTPVIGVFLGWWLADEIVNLPIVFACVLTTLSIFFIVSKSRD